MRRRTFLAGLTTTVAAATAAARWPDRPRRSPVPIIDTHIHLFDPTRPQGAPYSGPRVPGDTPIPAYPDRYRGLASPLGVVGAIKVEASPWIEDNLWALQVAETDTIMVAVIGNLEPEKPEFAEYLERHARNPLFRGIRYGNLWGRDLATQVTNPRFLDGVRLLAEADLVLDTANPTVALLHGVVRLTDRVPALRVVLDHLPALAPPDTAAQRSAYQSALNELGQRPEVYAKLSQIIHRRDGQVLTELGVHRPKLDLLLSTFGEDRVLFGSDWPNSDGVATLEDVVAIAQAYFETQPQAAAEKFFWKNSVRAYKWVRRDAAQPDPLFAFSGSSR